MNQTKSYEKERIAQIMSDLREKIVTDVMIPEELQFSPVALDFGGEPDFHPFKPSDSWGGFDEVGWFRYEMVVPEVYHGRNLWFEISMDKQGWYAQNPQFLLYCNGEALQGFDIYHGECLLTESATGGETLVLDIDAWSEW